MPDYIINSGDNLYSIAQRYGTTVENLMRMNNLSSNKIIIGNTLKVPDAKTTKVNSIMVKNNSAPATNRTGQVPSNKTKIRTSLQKRIDRNNFDVTTKFQGTVADLNFILKDTKLKGLGKNFLQAQEKYGVNALFMIAIAQKESTWGKFTPEKNPYNFAGLGIKNIKSFADCVDKLAQTLSGKNYFQAQPSKKTPSKIAPTYCPPKAAEWSRDVTKFMNNYQQKLLEEIYIV